MKFITVIRGLWITDTTRNINNPTITKPKLLKAFTGSLKTPPLTLSRHLETLPIVFDVSSVSVILNNPRITYETRKTKLITIEIGKTLFSQNQPEINLHCI